MALDEAQKALNELRIREHGHTRYEVDLDFGGNFRLNSFIVLPQVLRPEKTSALYFGRYLAMHRDLYEKKHVLDMGCGSGVQGIIAAMNGARSVTFSDISADAVKNTRENIERYNLRGRCRVKEGDLFSPLDSEVFDAIIFNQPFFDSAPDPAIPITRAIFDEGELIQRFLREARSHLQPGGVLIMPFFHFAGTTNDPGIQAPQHGFEISSKETIEVNDENIQKGLFSVYVLR